MSATFRHGISGCLALISPARRRLASEMISTPRWISHCFCQSASKAIERHIAEHGADAFAGLNDVEQVGRSPMISHQNTGTAAASIRARSRLWMLSRVMISVLHPRILVAASFTFISS